MPAFEFEDDLFTPGELRQSDADRLNDMVRELAAILRLNVDSPLGWHPHGGSYSLTCDIPDPPVEPVVTFAADAAVAVCIAPRKHPNGQRPCVEFSSDATMEVCLPLRLPRNAAPHCVLFAAPAALVICEDAAAGSNSGVTVRKNSSSDVGTRPRLNLIEGDGIALTVTDDAGDDEVDIEVALSPGTGAADGAVAGGAVDLTGTTTDAFVTIYDFNPGTPIMGHTHLKDTGGSNSLQLRIDATDAFGNTGSIGGAFGSTLIAGQKDDKDWAANQGAGTSGPYIRFQYMVKSSSAGNHTTYRLVGILGK